MDLGLHSKLVLVTGSTAGIGLGTAEMLAREGACVIVNGRTRARVDAAVERLKAVIPRCSVHGVAADVGTAAGCNKVIEAFTDVDVLVNNMGIFEPKPFGEITDAQWLRFFEANVLSGVRLARHYVNGMRARNWGRIVFVSSESGLQIPAEMIHYGVTKTAQIAVARGLAETLAGTQVTVNTVLPGPTASEGVSGFVGELGAIIRQGPSHHRARVLHYGASVLAHPAVRHDRGSRSAHCVHVQRAGIRDDRLGSACRRRRRSRDRLNSGRQAAHWRPVMARGDCASTRAVRRETPAVADFPACRPRA